MKKFTLAIVAVILSFVMTSCGDGQSATENLKKQTDEFFSKAEQNLENVTNADEFLDLVAAFNEEKNGFAEVLFAGHIDDEGNIKDFSEEELNDIQNYIFERATAYNQKEGAKCAEFLTPCLDRFEQAYKTLYENIEDKEQFDALFYELMNASEEINKFAEYDNVPVALQERYHALEAEFDELFPTEE